MDTYRCGVALGATFLVLAFAPPSSAQLQPAPTKLAPPPPGAPPPTPPASKGSFTPSAGGLTATTGTPSGGGQTNVAIAGLTSDGKCGIVVWIKNMGGELPANVDHVTYNVQREHATSSVVGTVPAAQLRAPGSVASVPVPGLATAYAAANYVAHVDSTVRDHRAGAAPTTFSQSLSCASTPPHLTLSVAFADNCTQTITMRNMGGAFPSSDYNAVFMLDLLEDGWKFDGGAFKQGMTTGATLTAPGPRAYDSVGATISSQWGVHGDEVRVPVPQRCRTGAAPHSLEVGDVTVNAQCYVTAVLKNTGAPFGAGLRVPVGFKSAAGNDYLEARSDAPLPTGGAVTITSRVHLAPATTPVTVTPTVPPGQVAAPKTVTLSCNH